MTGNAPYEQETHDTRAMPLPVVATFLPFAALIALVVIWPRRHATRSGVRLIAEFFAAVLLGMTLFYVTVKVLQWAEP